MTGVVVELAAGGALGTLATLLVQRLCQRRGRQGAACRTSEQPTQQLVDATLAQHAAARREQVAAFADRLAAGDTGLRECLRRFERGGAS